MEYAFYHYFFTMVADHHIDEYLILTKAGKKRFQLRGAARQLLLEPVSSLGLSSHFSATGGIMSIICRAGSVMGSCMHPLNIQKKAVSCVTMNFPKTTGAGF